MTRARPLWPILALLALVSCGSRTIDSSTGDANDDAANDDQTQTPDAMGEGVHGDPWECGEQGYKCIGPMGIGDCIDGECTGSLYSCFLGFPGTTCAQHCADEGVVCRELACEGATAFGWGLWDPFANELSCIEANEDGSTPLTIGCDEPIPYDTYTGVRCCCRYEG